MSGRLEVLKMRDQEGLQKTLTSEKEMLREGGSLEYWNDYKMDNNGVQEAWKRWDEDIERKKALGVKEIPASSIPSLYTPEPLINTLYKLMDVTHQLLVSRDIPYWCYYGTLLGYTRHGGIIPWDDDIDIMVPVEYKTDIEALEDTLRTCFGYRLSYYDYAKDSEGVSLVTDTMFKIWTHVPELNRNVFLDINFYTSSDTKYKVLGSLSCEVDEAPREWVDPIEEGKLGPVAVRVPSRGVELCKMIYGEDCMNRAQTGYFDHVNPGTVEEGSPLKQFDVSHLIGKPAQTTYQTKQYNFD